MSASKYKRSTFQDRLLRVEVDEVHQDGSGRIIRISGGVGPKKGELIFGNKPRTLAYMLHRAAMFLESQPSTGSCGSLSAVSAPKG